LRATRDRPDDSNNSRILAAANVLGQSLDELEHDLPLEVIRGKEGEAAKTYFNVFDHLIMANKNDFYLKDRSRRPPLDNMNSLLSFLYTILVHDVESALESVGLDPAVGFLHRDRPGRAGLALDLMEEFRPYLADRLALSLVNRQQIKPNGFVKTETGAVWMDDETRKTVLVAWQKRKQEEITHPFLDEKVQIGPLPYIQALLLARFLRGDLKSYPPFLSK
jgi:CRISPR-associated protein Cas1